jgi:hypothetical protein
MSMLSCMKLKVAVLACLVPALAVAASTYCLAEDRLAQVIENVRANEEIYRDIEVIVHRTMRLGNPKHILPNLAKSIDTTGRTIFQNELAYFKKDESTTVIAGKDQPYKTFDTGSVRGFDGQVTRAVEQNSYANLVEGRRDDPRMVRPHTMLLSGAQVYFPLSVYLKGGEALRSAQFSARYAGYWKLSVRMEGKEPVDGLACIKLRCETLAKGQPPENADIRYIWLATERNYLPIKTVAYSIIDNPKLPAEIGQVHEFREISPGVWFPFRASLVAYDFPWLKENKHIVANTQEFTVKKAALNPHYDISLFRDIPFRDGLKVYVIRDEKIVRSYKQGEQKAEQKP